ncbi:DUF6338 family protein [Kribbella kalugense]|uniref:Uncharacterized protein n=1 Tax=Kribbella kalugense TaxID=2512221 RepID=A0A4R7ZKJ3_9ACTN|nr:DUF6338 family protein [Kribbella kalugense]TDW17875.1 hypothetical protein EV650_4453 [Kribbella kalugense]
MVPSGLAALLVVLALVPGWYYIRLTSRLRARTKTTGLQELLEFVSVGALTTGTAVLIVVLLPHRWHPWTLDVDRWTSGGATYLRAHPRNAGWSVVTVLLLALVIATLLYAVQRLWKGSEFRPDGNVWVYSLGTRPKGMYPWVAVQLQNGQLVEGVLHSYTIEDLGSDRDIALRRPIRVSAGGFSIPEWLGLDRFIVSRDKIDYISVTHLPEEPKAPEAAGKPAAPPPTATPAPSS